MNKRILTLALGVAVLLAPYAAQAAAPADPYADSVQSSSGNGIQSPQNAVGAPDGQTASFAKVNGSITLDMGEGEEGTGSLKAYFGSLTAGANVRVDFLDNDLDTISSSESPLNVAVGASSQNFAYSNSQAYRYVRFTSLAEGVFGLDAVEALSYRKNVPSTATPRPGSSATPTPAADGGNKSRDVDSDGRLEYALNADNNSSNGYEQYSDPDNSSHAVLSTDGDGDGKIDHFIDTNNDGCADKYWDPDNNTLTSSSCPRTVGVRPTGSGATVTPAPNTTNIILYDSNGDGKPDRYLNPSDGRFYSFVTGDELAPASGSQGFLAAQYEKLRAHQFCWISFLFAVLMILAVSAIFGAALKRKPMKRLFWTAVYLLGVLLFCLIGLLGSVIWTLGFPLVAMTYYLLWCKMNRIDPQTGLRK